MTDLPSDEQTQRAKWNLLLLDIEHRTEQVLLLKHYEPWRFVFAAVTAAAALMAAGAGITVAAAALLKALQQ